ncbi:MAG: hypothetical protein AB7O52_17260 [Planctomycetota bacterium]
MTDADGYLQPLDLSGLTTYSIRDRKNLVRHTEFARLVEPTASVVEFLDSLPRFLAARELLGAAECTARSVRRGRPVVVALGGHVVKVGLGPVLIDLLDRKVISALVMNGATAIHDFEIAMVGATSEDVHENLQHGRFGMARETPIAFGRALGRARDGIGLGRAIGEQILADGLPHADVSLLAQAARRRVPLTVHVGVGTDTIHMHPEIDGAELGLASHLDFRLLARIGLDLDDGTWINMGSAVVLPEVFLKIVSLARNLGRAVKGVTAINFDMLQHYRTQQNVLKRPVDRGISITGHHEINIPLFRLALLAELARDEEPAT